MVQKTVVSAQSDSAADLLPASENVFVLASFPNITTDNEKIMLLIIIIIIIKGIYMAQVRNDHKCAMSAQMAVWFRNCLRLYSYLHY